jgi:hypothetical protein
MQIPWRGWYDIIWRTRREMNSDRLNMRQPKKTSKRHHLVVASPSGIRSLKPVPRGDFGSVSSPPNCFESALTRRPTLRLPAYPIEAGPAPDERSSCASASEAVSEHRPFLGRRHADRSLGVDEELQAKDGSDRTARERRRTEPRDGFSRREALERQTRLDYRSRGEALSQRAKVLMRLRGPMSRRTTRRPPPKPPAAAYFSLPTTHSARR